MDIYMACACSHACPILCPTYCVSCGLSQPRQARPRATRLPPNQVDIVQLREYIHRAGMIEVVSHRTRAADRHAVTSLAPAIEEGGLCGRAVIVQQPQRLLIAPHSGRG